MDIKKLLLYRLIMALQISHENNFSQFYPHLLPQLISFDHCVMSEMPFFMLYHPFVFVPLWTWLCCYHGLFFSLFLNPKWCQCIIFFSKHIFPVSTFSLCAIPYTPQSCIFTNAFVLRVLHLKPNPYFSSSYLLHFIHLLLLTVYLWPLFSSTKLKTSWSQSWFLGLPHCNHASIWLISQHSCAHSSLGIYPLFFIHTASIENFLILPFTSIFRVFSSLNPSS